MSILMLVLDSGYWGYWDCTTRAEGEDSLNALLFGLICRLRVRACRCAEIVQTFSEFLFAPLAIHDLKSGKLAQIFSEHTTSAHSQLIIARTCERRFITKGATA